MPNFETIWVEKRIEKNLVRSVLLKAEELVELRKMFLKFLFVGIFFNGVSCEKRLGSEDRGELGTEHELPLKETLTLITPPQPSFGRLPIWVGKEAVVAGTGITKPGSRTLQDFRVRGDEAALDPRGTVRYQIMPNGRIARGVITNKADQTALFAQAQGKDNPD